MKMKEKVAIVNECIKFVRDVDDDKPSGEFFDMFHEENTRLLNKLKKLKTSIRFG